MSNVGDGTATGINVTVSTGDVQATITPRARSYGNLAAGATRSRDFRLTLAPDFPRGKRISLGRPRRVRRPPVPDDRHVPGRDRPAGGRPDHLRLRGRRRCAIPDAVPAGVSVTIPVTGIGYASKLTFSVDGTDCAADTDGRRGRDRPHLGG